MLATLSIRDFLLVDRLDIEFDNGLCVLTGETGAGKSILLDALGLATGTRADASVVRKGARSATVAATFDLADDHPVFRHLAEIDAAPAGEPLVLRRTVNADGRSRAWIDDRAVSVGTLRSAGELLVEIEDRSARLLDPAGHRAALDAFGRLDGRLAAIRKAWDSLRNSEAALASARTESGQADADYLRHVHAELAALEPQPGEEASLADARAAMMDGEKIAEAVNAALSDLTGEDGIQNRLARTLRTLERVDRKGSLRSAVEALDRTAVETTTASDLLSEALAGIEHNPARLQLLEERLFALRALARKHGTDVESLPGLTKEFADRLEELEDADREIARLEIRARETASAYESEADALGRARREAAAALDRRLAAELPSLRLKGTRFTTTVSTMEKGGRDGRDRVRFEVASGPDLAPGPVDRIASRGELARLLLALRVVLAQTGRTLIFDEVDAGIGGAAAAAVAERLRRLAEGAQVLVVTHSPQVAARGTSHLRVTRTRRDGRERTTVSTLSRVERREEIARMLAGTVVTAEARAAAESLIAGVEE